MQNPNNYKYTKEHEWVSVAGDTATVGITFHAQELLTDIVFVELPKIGAKIAQNGNLGVVESVKSVSDIFSPVSGEVIAVNEELSAKSELVNQSPFEKGWIAKLKLANPGEINNLMSAADYENFIA